MPQAWRNGERLAQEQSDAGHCPILGLERDGERVYVVPTDRDYDALSAEGSPVAKRFCSDEAAHALGYAHLSGPATQSPS